MISEVISLVLDLILFLCMLLAMLLFSCICCCSPLHTCYVFSSCLLIFLFTLVVTLFFILADVPLFVLDVLSFQACCFSLSCLLLLPFLHACYISFLCLLLLFFTFLLLLFVFVLAIVSGLRACCSFPFHACCFFSLHLLLPLLCVCCCSHLCAC